MLPLVLMLEFTDLHQAAARIFDLVRRMGFDLDHCAIEAVTDGGYSMTLRLLDAADDPARRMTLVHRLSQIPAVDAMETGRAGRDLVASAPRPRPGLSSVLGTELPPA